MTLTYDNPSTILTTMITAQSIQVFIHEVVEISNEIFATKRLFFDE